MLQNRKGIVLNFRRQLPAVPENAKIESSLTNVFPLLLSFWNYHPSFTHVLMERAHWIITILLYFKVFCISFLSVFRPDLGWLFWRVMHCLVWKAKCYRSSCIGVQCLQLLWVAYTEFPIWWVCQAILWITFLQNMQHNAEGEDSVDNLAQPRILFCHYSSRMAFWDRKEL